MHQFSRPYILAWLVTGLLAFLVFAAGPLLLVAMTNLLLWSESGTRATLWLLSILVGALKVSALAAAVLTGLHLVRRRSSS